VNERAEAGAMFHHVAVEPMCNLQKRLKYIRRQLAFYALDMASSNPATELENVVFFGIFA
jgi:hypothetical protein